MIKLHRLSLLTTICFLALLIFSSSVNALFDSNVKKSKEFMQAGMFPQAIALLEKEISDNPTNAEAHFQLGICYINQSNYSNAEERFASAVRLNPEYGYKIGIEYQKTAEYNLKKGQLSSIRALYNKAIEYDPSLKKSIAQKLFKKGNQNWNDQIYSLAVSYDSSLKSDIAKNLFQRGKQTGNDRLFSLAVSYDNSLKNDVADYYHSLSQNSQGEDSLSLLAKALQYSDKYKNEFYEKKLEIGNLLLKEAKRLAMLPGKDKETAEYKNKAKKYLGDKFVKEELPEYKIYKFGEYIFSLKAGEQTDHWITFQVGRYNFSLGSDDDKFKVLYDDGEEVPAWTPGNWPSKRNFKFKIIAVTDQPAIKMTITEIK